MVAPPTRRIQLPGPVTPLQKVSLWKGPAVDGISYSLLCKFLNCMERFRLRMVEGLVERDKWSSAREYGTLFHECMEAHQAGGDWQKALNKQADKFREQYPADANDVTKWQMFCAMQFPRYINHWAKHPTQVYRKRLVEEVPFKIPYTIARDPRQPLSPRNSITTILRGKIDSAYLSRITARSVLYVQENKTKGDIDVEGLGVTIDQLLQTTIYHLAIRRMFPKETVAGTLYNVIRRPLSDRNSPRQKKKESLTQFVKRVGDTIDEDPGKHFYRWQTPFTNRHLERMCRETIDPVLRLLHLWWDGFAGDPFSPEKNPIHYRYPFGVYHAMERGYRGDYFDYYARGDRCGLVRIDNLFPEIH